MTDIIVQQNTIGMIGFNFNGVVFECTTAGTYINTTNGLSISLTGDMSINVSSENNEVLVGFSSESVNPQQIEFNVTGLTNVLENDNTNFSFNIENTEWEARLSDSSLKIINNKWTITTSSPEASLLILPKTIAALHYSARMPLRDSISSDVLGRVYSGQRPPEYTLRIYDTGTTTPRPIRYGLPVLSMVSANATPDEVPLSQRTFDFVCTPTYKFSVSPTIILLKLNKPGGLDTVIPARSSGTTTLGVTHDIPTSTSIPLLQTGYEAGLSSITTPPSFAFYPEDNINNVDGFAFASVFMGLNVDFDLPIRLQIVQSDTPIVNTPYNDPTLY